MNPPPAPSGATDTARTCDFRALVEQMPEALVVHRDRSVLYANGAAAVLLGERRAATLVGRAVLDFIPADDHAALQQRWRGDGAPVRHRLRRADGVQREVESVSVRVQFDGGPAVQTIFRDVTEQQALEVRLLHEAFHDSLTGLANRALFRDRLQHALALATRPQRLTAILFLDLDDFKGVNDSLGHETGDRLLVALADRLENETRDGDTVARFGGDEFAILLENLSAEREALSLVNRLKVSLRRPLEVDGHPLSVSASIGVAFARPEDNVDTLLRNADVAMYEAKEAGSGRHAVFEPTMYEAIVHRLQLEHDLREAVLTPEHSGLSVVYQPIVDLRTGALVSLEALLRWQHPERGSIPPATFIPVAERTGVIVGLGRWVIDTTCQQIAQWRADLAREGVCPATPDFSVAVNISGHQLSGMTFVRELEGILVNANVRPEWLTLEITESVIMRDTESALRTLSSLRQLGVRLAIDDFGTGYSSLSYLQRFPVDILKIDRSFIEGVSHGSSDAALARTIVTLGQTLNLKTVAEGIEHESQRQTLAEMGCHLGQGYLFAKPLSVSDVSRWLRGGHPGPVASVG